MQEKAPAATIILTGIFPRNDNMAVHARDRPRSTPTWRSWRTARAIRYLNINDKLADRDGKLFDGMMNAGTSCIRR